MNFPETELLAKGPNPRLKEVEREIYRRVFTPSIKRRIREFHFVVVQGRQFKEMYKKSATRAKLFFADQTYCCFDALVAVIIAKAPYCLSMFQALRNWGRRKVKRKALSFAPISTI